MWAVLTQDEYIAAWFGDEAQLDARVGGEGLFTWNDHGMTSRIRVERLDRPTAFSYRWGQGADDRGAN